VAGVFLVRSVLLDLLHKFHALVDIIVRLRNSRHPLANALQVTYVLQAPRQPIKQYVLFDVFARLDQVREHFAQSDRIVILLVSLLVRFAMPDFTAVVRDYPLRLVLVLRDIFARLVQPCQPHDHVPLVRFVLQAVRISLFVPVARIVWRLVCLRTVPYALARPIKIASQAQRLGHLQSPFLQCLFCF
jgi:hypothetical protein